MMSPRPRIRGLLCAGLVFLLSSGFPLTASADTSAEAAAQQAPARVQSLRRLGGASRFTAPVRNIDALKRTMSQARIQRDLGTVLDRVGLSSLRTEVLKNLAEGLVTETTLARGTSMEWMALRRGGRPDILRNVRWDGAQPLEGFQFIVDDLVETYTFFVPEICGNLALVSREPSREKARRDEDARLKADEARKAEAARAAAAAEAARKADEARKAEAARTAAEAARKAEEARKADEARKAEDARRAEEARKAEAARQAEADRLAAEERELRLRPFIAGLFGKQQRQYDDTDPAGLGTLTPVVPAFGNPLVGLKGGMTYKMSANWTFSPAIGVAFNLDEGDRTSLFADAEIARRFPGAKNAYLGTGLTLWDLTHSDIVTLGWLGTGGVPIWENQQSKHQLILSAEWRQLFDRMSDPDVNYQFWGGLKYLFR